MSGKRFRSRRRFDRTRIWAITAVILVSGGAALWALTGRSVYAQVVAVIGVVGITIGWTQDRRERFIYGLEGTVLILKRSQDIERVPLESILDASLVDSRAAREMLVERGRVMEAEGRIRAEVEEFQRRFTRWCSVDIGVRPFMLGTRIGPGRADLVLIRLRDGRSLLLSPIHAQDLVSSLNKVVTEDRRRERRA